MELGLAQQVVDYHNIDNRRFALLVVMSDFKN